MEQGKWHSEMARECYEELCKKIQERRTPQRILRPEEIYDFRLRAEEAIQPMLKEAVSLRNIFWIPSYFVKEGDLPDDLPIADATEKS